MMLSDSQLNVYVVGDNLSPRQCVQLQAQIDTALRALPQWSLDLIRAALSRTGVRNFPIVVEPQPADGEVLPLSLGRIEGRPAAYALNPAHPRWAGLQAVRGFLEGWGTDRGAVWLPI